MAGASPATTILRNRRSWYSSGWACPSHVRHMWRKSHFVNPTLSCWLIREYLQPPPPLPAPPPDPAPPTPSVDPTAAYPARCASRLVCSSCVSVLPAHPTIPILVPHRWLTALSAG